MRFFLIFFLFGSFIQGVTAQLTKVLHQTFEIDSVENLTINIVGEYELEKWAGNNILTETKIEIYNTTTGTFKYLIEEKKRYEIVAEINSNAGSLFSFDSKRGAIKNKETGKECYEFIKVKIFVPDNFNIDDTVNLVRIIDSETSSHE